MEIDTAPLSSLCLPPQPPISTRYTELQPIKINTTLLSEFTDWLKSPDLTFVNVLTQHCQSESEVMLWCSGTSAFMRRAIDEDIRPTITFAKSTLALSARLLPAIQVAQLKPLTDSTLRTEAMYRPTMWLSWGARAAPSSVHWMV